MLFLFNCIMYPEYEINILLLLLFDSDICVGFLIRPASMNPFPPPPDERKYTSADHQTAPGLKETKMFLPHPRVKVSIVGSLRDREVACSASDHQGFNFESCVWRTVSSQSSHHPQEVLLAQFSLYVHKGGLKPDLFIFLSDLSRLGFVTEAFVYLCLKATQ